MLQDSRFAMVSWLVIAGMAFWGIPQSTAQTDPTDSVARTMRDTLKADSLELTALDTLKPDSLASSIVEKKSGPIRRFFSNDYPDPSKAAMLSIIPGGGQIYNKKYWWIKVPAIYGGLGWLGYLAQFNNEQYRSYRDAYIAELAGEPHAYSDLPFPLSAATLKLRRDAYDKRRQQTYIGIAAVYLVNVIEAYVSAHLLNFDVDEDLSFKIVPGYQNVDFGSPAQPSLGIRVQF